MLKSLSLQENVCTCTLDVCAVICIQTYTSQLHNIAKRYHQLEGASRQPQCGEGNGVIQHKKVVTSQRVREQWLIVRHISTVPIHHYIQKLADNVKIMQRSRCPLSVRFYYHKLD